jgi:hypothetical protein
MYYISAVNIFDHECAFNPTQDFRSLQLHHAVNSHERVTSRVAEDNFIGLYAQRIISYIGCTRAVLRTGMLQRYK